MSIASRRRTGRLVDAITLAGGGRLRVAGGCGRRWWGRRRVVGRRWWWRRRRDRAAAGLSDLPQSLPPSMSETPVTEFHEAQPTPPAPYPLGPFPVAPAPGPPRRLNRIALAVVLLLAFV